MSARSGRLFALVSLVALLVCVRVSGEGAPAGLPDRLTDSEFWALTGQLSEPGGHFRSDNLVSNERHYPEVLRDLTRRVPPGSVYLGVGPEQNFSYIAATRPARTGNAARGVRTWTLPGPPPEPPRPRRGSPVS